MRKQRSKWIEGLHHAERMVQAEGIESLTHLIRTHEYVDADPEFFIGVTDYQEHYMRKLRGRDQ